MNCAHCSKRLSRKSARLIDGVVMCSKCMFAPAKQRKTLAPIEAALAGETVGLDAQHESGIGSEYYSNTPGTHTMTNTPNPGDQAVEAVADHLDDEIQSIASIYKFSSLGDRDRAVSCMAALARRLSAIPTPPPADQPEALNRLRRVGKAQSGDERMFTVQDAEAICAYIDTLEARPADHTDLIARKYLAEALTLVTEAKTTLGPFAVRSAKKPLYANANTAIWKLSCAIDLLKTDALQAHASPREYWHEGAAIIEGCLAKAVRADPLDAPMPLVGREAKLWLEAQADAYRHALEMMAPPTTSPSRTAPEPTPRVPDAEPEPTTGCWYWDHCTLPCCDCNELTAARTARELG